MSNRMKLELLLKGVDQLSGVVKKQSPLLKTLDKNATKAYESLQKLFNLAPKTSLGNFGKQSNDFRKVNTEAAKLKKTFESIGRTSANVRGKDMGLRSFTVGTNQAAEAQKRLNAAIKQQPKSTAPAPASGSSPRSGVWRDANGRLRTADGRFYGDGGGFGGGKSNKYVRGLANINDGILEPIAQTKNVWRDQVDSLKQYTDEASRLLRLQGRFKQINLSETDNKKVFSAVEQNAKNVRGISLADSQDLFANIYNALGDVDASIAALPAASKYKVATSALYGDIYSPAEISNQIQKGFKFLEQTGATKDRAALEERFATITKIANATGGEVTMEKLLGLVKQAAPAVQGLSERGIRNVTSVVDEMGGERTGTALSALYRAWVGGVMKQEVAQRYQELGFIKEGYINFNKSGILKSVKPGGNILGDLMAKDPLAAFDRLTEAVKADAAKKGIDVSTPELLNKQLRGLFGTETSFRLANAMVNNRFQVEKESSRAEKAESGIQTYDRMNKDNNPQLKLEEYKAALDNFRTKAGIPLIQALGKLAATATPIMEFFGSHPTVTQFALAAILASKGINGIGQTASIISQSGLLKFFRNSTAAANGATTAINGTSGALSSLKSPASIVLRVGALIGLGLALDKAIDEANKAAASKKTAGESIAGGYKAWRDTEKELNSNSQIYVQSDFDARASTVWDGLKGLGLNDALASTRRNQSSFEGWKSSMMDTWMYPISKYTGAENKFTDADNMGRAKTWLAQIVGMGAVGNQVGLTKEGVKTGFSAYASNDLQDPRIMAAILRQLPERVPDKGDQQVIREGLQEKFPESFTAAMRELAGLNFAPLTQAMTDISAQSNAQKANAEQIAQIGQVIAQSQQPFSVFNTNVGTLGETSGQANTPLGNLAGSAGRASSSVDGFASKIANFQMPTPQVQTFSIGIPAAPAAATPFSILGKASGGTVKSDGLAYIHKGEDIVPADVTSKYRAPKNFTRESDSIIPAEFSRNRRNLSAGAPSVSLNVTINVDGSSGDGRKIAEEMRREMALVVRDIQRDFTPDRMAQQVEFAAQRDSERL